MQRHFYEGDGHGEDHPDVDHLDVRSHRQSLSETQKTEKDFKNCQILVLNLQCGQHKLDGKVDLNDHVNVVLRKSPGDEADGDEGGGGDEDGQDVAHDRPP